MLLGDDLVFLAEFGLFLATVKKVTVGGELDFVAVEDVRVFLLEVVTDLIEGGDVLEILE